MARSIPLFNIVSSGNLGYSDLPSKDSFLAYHLFGEDEASSVLNRVNAAQPLTVVGAPTYDAYSASCGSDDGFVTPFTTLGRDRTLFVAYTDPYKDNSGALVTNPPAAPVRADKYASRKILGWNHNAGSGVGYLQVDSSSYKFRYQSDPATDLTGATKMVPIAHPTFYPDGTVQLPQFNIAALSCDAAQARMILQNGGAIQDTVTGATSGTAPIASTVKIGALLLSSVISTTYRFHVAAFAVASALDDAAMRDCMDFMYSELAGRGMSLGPRPMDFAV